MSNSVNAPKTRPKVIVVGAGPAGSSFALTLARRTDAEVLLLDKSSYPRVKVCGSGLSPHALEVLKDMELLERFAPRHGEIKGLIARGPSRKDVVVRGGGKGAWVVPRVEFDHTLCREAMMQGVEMRENVKVIDVLENEKGVCGVKTVDEEIEADLVVFANGSPSRFSDETRPRTGIRTIMGWWQDTHLPREEAIMAWDERLEGYYAWSFPELDGTVNVGLTIPEEADAAKQLKALFQDILDQHFGLGLKDAEQIGKWMGHPATVTTRIGNLGDHRRIFIGEAARLVSPGTVEGISFAMESGVLAAELVARHFDRATGFSTLGQRKYKRALQTSMVPKFLAGEAFVRVMNSRLGRRVGAALFGGPVNQFMSRAVVTVLGEKNARA